MSLVIGPIYLHIVAWVCVGAACDYAAQQGSPSQAHSFTDLEGKEGYCENSDGTTWLVGAL